jgi:hypothetical protein
VRRDHGSFLDSIADTLVCPYARADDGDDEDDEDENEDEDEEEKPDKEDEEEEEEPLWVQRTGGSN